MSIVLTDEYQWENVVFIVVYNTAYKYILKNQEWINALEINYLTLDQVHS
jgi:hypothetical protein